VPQQQPTYPLQVGSPGEQRLAILNEIYNPASQQFLLDQGLQQGMTVVEAGCGTGLMACWLAKQVGPTGKIIATDQSRDQIKIAQQNAQTLGLTNIEFITLPVENFSEIDATPDLTFARWTLCFTPKPELSLKAMHDLLKPNGILVLEELNIGELGCFAYPANNLVERWMDVWKQVFIATNKDLYFAQNLYLYLTQLHCHTFSMSFNQPALHTAREKSVMPLAIKEIRDMVVQHTDMTLMAVELFIHELEQFIEQPSVLGFLRSILVGVRK
jgi:ubiquinone/menaquinone biosynthesis C-methylase UbiE